MPQCTLLYNIWGFSMFMYFNLCLLAYQNKTPPPPSKKKGAIVFPIVNRMNCGNIVYVVFFFFFFSTHIVNDGTHVKIDTYLQMWIRKKEIS